ncbi:MAG: hypothetical protein O3C20_24105 [Verrucomicrobia bacterium]|nr:hypothetical protein [Verrucomicrobiota bacterium]
MKTGIPLITILLGLSFIQLVATDLKPQMVQLDKLILEEDFSHPRTLEKENWSQRQHTRWAIKEGVLKGLPSSAEFQASAKDHQGFEPRLSIPSCPDEFAIQFSVKFTGGKETAICPFIEFGHHKARLRWSNEGAQLMANGESVQLDQDASFKLKSGTWYHALAEVKGDEFFIQFSHGPQLYGKHSSIDAEKDGFGVAGFKGGQVELDNIKVWSVKAAQGNNWAKHLSTLKPGPHKILKTAKTKSY